MEIVHTQTITIEETPQLEEDKIYGQFAYYAYHYAFNQFKKRREGDLNYDPFHYLDTITKFSDLDEYMKNIWATVENAIILHINVDTCDNCIELGEVAYNIFYNEFRKENKKQIVEEFETIPDNIKHMWFLMCEMIYEKYKAQN